MEGRANRAKEAVALLANSQDWHIAHATDPWQRITIAYTREQKRLPPPDDPAIPSGSWYNDDIIAAYSHLLRREQSKITGVMHNNDVITAPNLTYYMTLLHEADPVKDEASIARWTTRFVQPWRDEIRRAKPVNIYIPYQANGDHWILLCISTTH
eukprot:COSAG06_NODE_4460_length_4239_cov_7.379952_3_plen_155_part_00